MAKKQSLEEIIKAEFRDCRYHADAMALMVKKYRTYDRTVNIFLAITSSGSIASWTIWSQFAMVWGGVIALSQLINVLKPLFPFSKHVHTLNTRCYKQEVLFLELEELWFLVKDKRISEEDAQSRLSFMKKRISENVFFDDDDGFEFSREILDKASIMTADTLKTKYNIE